MLILENKEIKKYARWEYVITCSSLHEAQIQIEFSKTLNMYKNTKFRLRDIDSNKIYHEETIK